ncbi:MAG: pseudouridine-5'-phosphate glycosidase [Chloroflexi bacterium]|uniref:Pseudouridine-5'-phosphate glycosidase n=1 Tax=Candidatus Chlorohelix allophototropha TaxID=3003348 RepID=A0A8T7M1K7_9CHLR|nr:pseudouridine-5'-phosphate glycosidase [Chloroflexota bacterium]WJW67791.1 pseudouridine-5'-phosphate glycosidase [Chloroflexota bacterium L227-S17]
MQKYLEIGEEVRQPAVALESTVISHGLPYPENIQTARALEETVRQNGANPATIALMDGKIKVGLGADALEKLATAKDVAKVSRRDFAAALARGTIGATTVAATMIAAQMAGIKVFATGGIGGVHRGAAQTFDISADLTELARTPVLVVCAGAKAILDLELTMEYLETQGVPVIGYGTNELPAFYTAHSGISLELRADSPEEVAAIARTQWDLGFSGGLVVVVPPPASAALSADEINRAIEASLQQAGTAGVKGKAVSPFLLAAVSRETGGKSLTLNMALLKNNAAVAAQIAKALYMTDARLI